VAALQAIDSTGGLVHEFRGLSLAAHAGNAEDAAAVLAHNLDISPALALLERTVAAPACDMVSGTSLGLAVRAEGCRVLGGQSRA
jgi:hypothetical protein